MQLVVDHILTHYTHTNTKAKKLLLILHGWGHQSSHWKDVAERISSDYQVITPDLPAFGDTQPLPDGAGVKDYSNFINHFLKKLPKDSKPSLVTILGHSFGGQIALDLVLNHKELADQLILVSPAVIRSHKLSLKSRLLSALKIASSFLPKKLTAKLGNIIASKDYQNATPLQKKILSKIIREDYSNKLKDITLPTTIIWGSDDQAIPYHGKTLAEQIPESELVVLYGQGHNPHLTHPDKLAKIINSALK